MTFTAPPPLAVEPKAITISQYEALTSDIEIARQGAVESFDYNDPKGDKAARSYIAGLRKIRSRIESSRKQAKSYALEYGRAVDAQAKALDAEILGLIEPHQQALDEIAQREMDRVAGHEESLRLILAMVQSAMVAGQPAAVIREAITWLQVCPTGEMEEFEQQANAEIDNGLRILEALHAAAVEREKREALEAAEAQRLAEEEAARRKAEKEARQAEAVERARQDAAAEAARSVAEAEQRAKESDARAAAAERLRQAQESARQQEDKRRAIAQQEAEAALRRAEVTRRACLAAELSEALASKTRAQAVEALLDGTLHPAVCIDWAKA
jgi:hypothetical protein